MQIGNYNIINPFRSPLKKIQSQQAIEKKMPVTSGNNTDKPLKPGRSSEDPNAALFGSQRYTPISPEFAIEWLPVLENLAVYNQDVGFAVDNIVQLSNTPYEIEFRDDANDKIRKEVTKLINDNKNKWYNYSEGLNSYHSDLLAQAAINGAISTEIVPNKKLDNIYLVRVAPKYIRFMYDKVTEQYKPFQISSMLAQNNTNIYGYRELNQITYKYVAWRRIHEGPYPVPPFLTAIKTLDIQADIIENIGFIIEKLGMMGFLSVKVTPPDKKTGESDDAYYTRMTNYLETQVYPQIEKNLKKGVVVGFKNSHEFSMEASNNNPMGAERLVKLVELMLFAGLKQDPNMLGRNFSTTETFGRVILAKMTNQVKEYQNMLNSIDLEIFRLFILLKGYDPEIISAVLRDPATISDKKSEAEARSKEIDNAVKLRDEGIIDQQQAANETGYDEPAVKDFVEKKAATQDPNKPTNPDDPNNINDNNDQVQEEIKRIERKLNIQSQEYNYETHNCHGTKTTFMKSSDFGDRDMNKFVKKYGGEVYEKYSAFVVSAINKALKSINNLNSISPLQTFQDSVYLAILEEWDNLFVNKVENVVSNNVKSIYNFYRKDKNIFGLVEGFKSAKSFDFEIPEPLFNLDDFRTIEYATQSDNFYLGKFITDDSTKKKIYDYIESNYIEGQMQIGNDPKSIAEFKNKFGNIFDFESYKIRRIVDTTVNNLRNDGNIQYINQAELTEYEVVEIGDTNTCEYCNFMNGQVFEVSKAVNKINNKINLTPDNISTVSPFVTSIKINEFKEMSSDDLQRAGFSTPSYHASCRGRIVARQ